MLGRIVVCRVGMAPRNDREDVKYPNMVGKNVLKMTTRLIMTIEKLRNALSRNAQVCREIFSLARKIITYEYFHLSFETIF